MGIISLICSNESYAQKKKQTIHFQHVDSSQIVFSQLNEMHIKGLERIGRIWGFLKYHHPAVGKGTYDWDKELFRILPAYLNVSSYEEQEKLLYDWIDSMGEVPICTSCVQSSPDAVQQPNHDWIKTYFEYQPLQEQLIKIYHNRNQGNHYYITSNKGNNTALFTNENAYVDKPYPDAATRLLALFRYWNSIQYFYPYKHLTNQPWDKVLPTYITKFINATNELEYELVVLELMTETNDSHAMIRAGNDQILKQKGLNYAPFRAWFIENQFIMVDDYQPQFTNSIGIKKGDRITHINGKKIEDLIQDFAKYYPVSNQASFLRNIALDLLRSSASTMIINYESDGKNVEKEIQLYTKDQLNYYAWYKSNPQEKGYKILDHNIGFVSIAHLKENEIPKLKKDLGTTQGIIIDLRNYPTIKLPEELGSYFVNDKISFAKFSYPNLDHPGEFLFSPENRLLKQKITYNGKVVVLVNEVTQSAAEFLTMALQVGKQTIIMGSQTAGANGNVISIVLPGGIETWISGLGAYYPDGKETQRIGIPIDVEIKPTRKGIQENRDELLEKAIHYLK